MKWYSESNEAKVARTEGWLIWFAWYPVRIGEEIFWLEKVYRRAIYFSDGNHFSWVYQEILRNQEAK